VPRIAYKLCSLHDLPEIALVKTVHVAQKTPFCFSTVLTENYGFWFQFSNCHSTIDLNCPLCTSNNFILNVSFQ